MLCIAPSFISREDYFGSFCEVLLTRADSALAHFPASRANSNAAAMTLDNVDDDCVISFVSPIPEAYTPVIKFCLNDQSIDMIFVSIQNFIPQQIVGGDSGTNKQYCSQISDIIPESLDILDNSLLKGLDDKSIRSINGCRVTERILQLVPNIDTFCLALRAIKHWARQRGIYSNVLGFLGGVNYAIMVAFICQRYINACPATIVKKFFVFYCQWRWPHPIILTHMEDRSADLIGVAAYEEDNNSLEAPIPDQPAAALQESITSSNAVVVPLQDTTVAHTIAEGADGGVNRISNGKGDKAYQPNTESTASDAGSVKTRHMVSSNRSNSFGSSNIINRGFIPSVWNPMTNGRDASHLMPIITPCYPSMNSAYNVGLSQFRLLQV